MSDVRNSQPVPAAPFILPIVDDQHHLQSSSATAVGAHISHPIVLVDPPRFRSVEEIGVPELGTWKFCNQGNLSFGYVFMRCVYIPGREALSCLCNLRIIETKDSIQIDFPFACSDRCLKVARFIKESDPGLFAIQPTVTVTESEKDYKGRITFGSKVSFTFLFARFGLNSAPLVETHLNPIQSQGIFRQRFSTPEEIGIVDQKKGATKCEQIARVLGHIFMRCVKIDGKELVQPKEYPRFIKRDGRLDMDFSHTHSIRCLEIARFIQNFHPDLFDFQPLKTSRYMLKHYTGRISFHPKGFVTLFKLFGMDPLDLCVAYFEQMKFSKDRMLTRSKNRIRGKTISVNRPKLHAGDVLKVKGHRQPQLQLVLRLRGPLVRV